MKLTNRLLNAVLAALDGVGKNRLPLDTTDRLLARRRFIVKCIEERDELRKALVESYLPEGRDPKEGVLPDDPGFPELAEKLNELWDAEIAMNGKVIDFAALPPAVRDGMRVEMSDLGVLQEVGIVKNGGDGA